MTAIAQTEQIIGVVIKARIGVDSAFPNRTANAIRNWTVKAVAANRAPSLNETAEARACPMW